MRKVELNMNEILKYKVIKKLVETNGNKNNASIKLGLSIRQINRLIKLIKEKGKKGFIHGNRGRSSNRKVSNDLKKNIVNLYINKYYNANIKHFTELLEEKENIKLSNVCIRNILLQYHILSPRASKKVKKRIKQKLLSINSNKLKNEILDKIDLNPHCKRQKSKYFGELIQMDTSSFDFLGNGSTLHLHIAVDDSTNTIVGAYLDYQETLNGYYNVLYQIIQNYGIPISFYTDRRTVFEYKKKNSNKLVKDTHTQFSYACHQLGIEIKTTSIAQAKGLVEKYNDTFQSRLPIELRLAGIDNIDDANIFLIDYLKKFNKKFALQINNSKNAFEKQENMEIIKYILGVVDKRIIHNDHSIKYNKKSYFLIDKNNKRKFFKKNTEVLVIEAFDKNIYASVDDEIFCLEEIPLHKEVSREFDFIDENSSAKSKIKKKYIPPMNHPWRLSYFNNYLENIKHRSV